MKTAICCRDLAFFPGGGGQPKELSGRLIIRNESYLVKDLVKHNGDVFIVLDSKIPYHDELKKGEPVRQLVDMERRLRAARIHTGQHAFGGTSRLLLPDYRTAGMQIADDLNRCEMRFQTSASLSDRMIIEIAETVTEAIAKDLPVEVQTHPSVSAVQELYGDIFRLDPTLPEFKGNRLRTVVIGEPGRQALDVSLCGGTHVRSLREVGAVTIVEWAPTSNVGEFRLVYALK